MINFLDLWLSASPEGIMGAITKGFRTLCFNLCTTIYEAIIFVYNIFDKLCKGRFLNNEIIQSFAERIGVILGLVMAFIVIFSLIKMVLDPDKVNDKEMGAGALIKKIIITIVMLGTATYIFNLLYLVQKTIIESDAISKLLLPVQIDKNESDNFGNILSLELLTAFYYVADEEQFAKCAGITDEFKNQIIEYGNFQLGFQCLNETAQVETETDVTETFVVNYNALFSVVVGAIVLYLLFVYCINVGIRMIQLMFLEIIAPMAIVSYVSPKKDTMFSKWTKIYIATYIDVFIRIAIINFVIFIIATIFATTENGFAFWGSVYGNADVPNTERNFVMVIIVIALLTFAKKAPELLKEILPKGDSKLGFGLSSPKQLFDGMLGGNTIRKGVTAGAKIATYGSLIGAAGAITSGVSRYRMNMKSVDKNDPEAMKKARKKAAFAATGGAFMAMGRGLKTGATAKGNIFSNVAKGVNTQRGIDDKYDELISSGGSPMGSFKAKLSSFFGETKGQTYTRHLNNYEKLSKSEDELTAIIDKISFVADAKNNWETLKREDGESDQSFRLRQAKAKAQYKAVFKAAAEKAINGKCDENQIIAEVEYETGEVEVVRDSNGKIVLNADGSVKKKPKMKQEKIIFNFDEDKDDFDQVFKAESQFKSLEAFVDSNLIELYDENTDSMTRLTVDDLKKDGSYSFKGLKNANKKASKSKTKIVTSEDYSKAIADDKNAGVNSNATTKK